MLPSGTSMVGQPGSRPFTFLWQGSRGRGSCRSRPLVGEVETACGRAATHASSQGGYVSCLAREWPGVPKFRQKARSKSLKLTAFVL